MTDLELAAAKNLYESGLGVLCRFIRYMSIGCGDCPLLEPKNACGINSQDKAATFKEAHETMDTMEGDK